MNCINKRLFVAMLLFVSIAQILWASVSITNPKVEMLTNPIGLDCATPRFSWQISSSSSNVQQTSYQILVATSPQKLKPGQADVWDSGVQSSSQSAYIDYAGHALQSRSRYYWRVLVSTNRGKTSGKTSFFEIALMNPSEWTARWIGHSFNTDKVEQVEQAKTKVRARYLRKDFSLEANVRRATLYISGLGLYEAYINGNRIGKQELAPSATEYNVRVKYNTFDVTSQVRKGQNAIGVILGNGRYVAMRNPGQTHYGLPRLLAQLEITLANGQKRIIASDDTWTITNQGPIGNNNEFDGEEYDARKEMPGWNQPNFNASSWQKAEIVEAPKGRLEAQANLNITKMDEVKPISIKETRPGVYLLDMGQNMVGWIRMKVSGKAGDELKLHFVETLNKDGQIYAANLRSAETTDTYILKGNGTEIWQPSFTYHGFRYVEMSGFQKAPALSDIVGEVLYDQMDNLGAFESSSQIFNQIYHNAYWGIRGNYRSMPTDCPQRDERMGWTGDRGIGCLGESFLFNNQKLYAKWLDDIGDEQRQDGSVPDVCPTYWQIYSDNMTWPGAWLTAANMLYDQFGDKRPIIAHYDGMKKWMLYMKSKYMTNYILTRDTYGDWCMPPESPELIHSKDPSRITDGKILSTTFYFMLSRLMAKFAGISGHSEDVQMWMDLSNKVDEAFNQTFFNAEKGFYGNNTVTANILPLRFGMVPQAERPRVFRSIVEKTTGDFKSHVSTGLIGIQQLMRGLTDYGRGDLAWTIATNTTYPSWGYMAKHGATTIWELWNGNTADPAMNSGNHVMLLGDLLSWTYNYLAGIGQTPESAGYKSIVLKPYPVEGLTYIRATYRSIYGNITSDWKKSEGRFVWSFSIPCNTSALVQIPSSHALSASDLTAVQKAGGRLRADASVEGYTAFEFPSGNYKIDVAL